MKSVFASMLLVLAMISGSASLLAQEPLTNETVVKMVKAGLGEEIILGMINAQPGKYSLSVDNLISLKTSGVSDKVIAAMVRKNEGATSSASGTVAAAAPAPAKTGMALPDELGVYHLKEGAYLALKPEILNLRTARAASMFTSGIVAAKINGWVVGQHSPNRVSPEAQIVTKLAEGTDPSEYVLLRFTLKDDRREVELARGRINVSASTHRAALPFTSEKLDKGVYRLRFGTLAAGEYGLLPPGANLSANAASAGKVYTFLVE